MNIRRSGVYGDKNSGQGLYEGVPSHIISSRTWFTQFTDFAVSADVATANWTTTQLGDAAGVWGTGGSGGVLVQDSLNGRARLFTTNVDVGVQTQYDGTASGGAMLVPLAGRTIVFEACCSILNWDDCAWFIGLMPLDTGMMSVAADATIGDILAVGADNHVGFHMKNNTGQTIAETTPYMTYAGTAVGNRVRTAITTETLTDLGAGTIGTTGYVLMGVRITGLNVLEFYWGTRLTGTTEPGGTQWQTKRLARVQMGTAFAASTSLTPTFAIVNNSANDNYIEFDYLMVAQTR